MMGNELEQKYLLLMALYDATYVLKKAIETQEYDQIEQMVLEREHIIQQIDALKLNEMDGISNSEAIEKIKTMLIKIKEIDDFNLKNMPSVILTLQESINESKIKTNEVNKAKMVYDQYQGVPMYKQGNRFDIRK
ncbi:hypothetical protein [Fusibacter sp. 3D3]|uniref:hypothetical protein n=1 Tax=Fusibacter sp. 3D3 TaxID=1048380 RepID=UPI001112CAA4|nr:hypothetical protein [Fusibacter sp. 3D3]